MNLKVGIGEHYFQAQMLFSQLTLKAYLLTCKRNADYKTRQSGTLCHIDEKRYKILSSRS